MKERTDGQAWAEPRQTVFSHPAVGGALSAARSNRPSSATGQKAQWRREERPFEPVRPSSASNSSAGNATALARQRRRSREGAGSELTAIDSIDELMLAVDELLSPEASSHLSQRPASAGGHSNTYTASHSGGGQGAISFKPRPLSATGQVPSGRVRRLENSLYASIDVRPARNPSRRRAAPASPRLAHPPPPTTANATPPPPPMPHRRLPSSCSMGWLRPSGMARHPPSLTCFRSPWTRLGGGCRRTRSLESFSPHIRSPHNESSPCAPGTRSCRRANTAAYRPRPPAGRPRAPQAPGRALPTSRSRRGGCAGARRRRGLRGTTRRSSAACGTRRTRRDA